MEESIPVPTISVVAPVYKVEKYLRDCVESVLAQSFTDFELILVDDGSPDKSGEICDELAKKDSRIRVFHQANGGVTSARRLGVENARGEWICFMDSDDLLPESSLRDLFAEATDDTDWVQGMRPPFDDGETPREEKGTGKVTSFDLVELVERMLTYHTGPYAKLVRRKLFSPNVLDIPPDIKVREDSIMNLRLIANRPRKPKEIDKVVYLHRLVKTSVSHSNLMTEKYFFRYTKLLFAELRKIITPSNKEKLLTALSQHIFCGSITYILIAYGLPIKFPHRLATLMRLAARSNPKYFFTYLCLSAGCPSIAQTAAKIYHFLHGQKLDLGAKSKTILE